MNRLIVLIIMKLLGALIFLTAIQFQSLAATTVTVDGLRYKLSSNGKAAITFQTEDSLNYDGLVNLEIPKQIMYESRKYTVTAIDAMAFQNCTTLETIVIPPTIEFIGMETMTDPTYPSSILLKKDVELNRHSPFYGCSSLSKVTFLDGGKLRLEMNARYSIYNDIDNVPRAESITEPLFDGCPIRELYFGRTLAYNKCVRMVSANDQKVSCTYVPVFWSLYSYNFSLEELTIGPEVSELPEGFVAKCKYLRKVTIGKNLKVIPRRCFWESGISDIQIGESVDSIAPNAFGNCYSLKSIVIPANVNVVGDQQNGESAFFYKLKDLDIAESDRPLRLAAMPSSSLDLDHLHLGREIDGPWPFNGCKIKNVEMNGGFSELPAEAFKDNTSLISVTLSEHTTKIPKSAFSGCGLTELPNLKNVTILDNWAFENCNIKEIDNFYNVDTLGYSVFYGNPIERLIINGKVASVGSITKMPNLIEISLGDNVLNFEGCHDCPSLKSVYLNDKITHSGSMSSNSALKNIRIGKSISTIDPYCFYRCGGLEALSIPANVSVIGTLGKNNNNDVFDSCDSLKNVRFEDGDEPLKTGIDYFSNNKVELYTPMFYGCPLETVYLGRNIWYSSYGINDEDTWNFDYSIFSGRKKLRTVILGPGVKILPHRIFTGCVNLSEVICLSSDIRTNSDKSFSYYCDSEKIVYIPIGTKSIFESNVNWKDETLKEYALYRIKSLPLHTIDFSSIIDAQILSNAQYFESTNASIVRMSETNHGDFEILSDGQSEIIIRDIEKSILAVVVVNCVSPISGDSNANGYVSITDAVNTANYAIGHDVENFCIDAADVNGDRRISFADASGTVAIVLDQPIQTSSIAKVRALASATDTNSDMLVIDDYSAKNGETTSVFVALDNTRDYVALQADVTVPEGITLAAVNIGNRAKGNHSLAVKRIDDRTMRVALFDINNSIFADNDDAILELIVKVNGSAYDRIEINNILASDAQAHEYALTAIGGNNSNMSGIDNVGISNIRIETTVDGINIYKAEGCEVAIYAVDGTTLEHFVASSDVESCKVVPGIYVVTAGNKTEKVMVK